MRKRPLVGQIMNRHHGRRSGTMAIVQVGRRESGLPVVSMYDFRHERRDGSLADLGRHSRKRGKAHAIVGPIRAAWRYIWVSTASKKMRRVEHKQIELVV